MNKENTNKKFWEKVAKLYTPMQERKNAELYRELCEIISKSLNKNMQVLELACGTGQLTLPLCTKTASWEATDFSEKMVEEAKARAINLPVTFTVQDATNLPYEDGTFDAVIIANALHIMPNPDKALAEIRRVLKKGGLLSFLTGKLAEHCATVEKAAFEMSEKIRAGFLNKNPMAEDDTMERIHLSTQAQMIADELVAAQIICI